MTISLLKMFVFTLSLLSFSANSFAEDVKIISAIPTKEQDIHNLMVLSKANDIPDAMIPIIVAKIEETVKQTYPEVSEKIIKNAIDDVKKNIVNMKFAFIETMIPIYAQNFTHDEVIDIIDFLSSPTGKKFVLATPVVSKKLEENSLIWAQAATQKSLELVAEFIAGQQSMLKSKSR